MHPKLPTFLTTVPQWLWTTRGLALLTLGLFVTGWFWLRYDPPMMTTSDIWFVGFLDNGTLVYDLKEQPKGTPEQRQHTMFPEYQRPEFSSAGYFELNQVWPVISPNSQWLALQGTVLCRLDLRSAATHKVAHTMALVPPEEFMPNEECRLNAIVFSPNSQLVAVGVTLRALVGPDQDRSRGWVAVIEVATGAVRMRLGDPQQVFNDYRDIVRDLYFTPDSQDLMVVNDGLERWHLADQQRVYRIDPARISVSDLAFSPDGQWMALVENTRIVIRRVRDGEVVQVLDASRARVVAWSPDGRMIATTSWQDRGSNFIALDFPDPFRPWIPILIWDTTRWEVVQTLRGHAYGSDEVLFSPDSHYLLSSGDIWRMAPRNPLWGHLIWILGGLLGLATIVRWVAGFGKRP
jgi:WD40 repeat protein